MRLYDKLHSAAPGKVGIVSSAEGLGSLEGYEAVAISAGFEDPFYFSRVFRREMGVSPTEYRAGRP